MADYTVSWTILDPKMRVQGIAEVSSVLNHPLGTRVQAKDATLGVGEFIYVKGVSSGAANAFCTYYPDDWSTALLAANAIAPVGIMQAALDASTKYGWLQIYGKGVGLVAAGYADNGLVYATATPGTADDAPVAGDRVKCALGASAINHPDTGLAEMELYYPYMDDGSAA